jgi:hypothetical protein
MDKKLPMKTLDPSMDFLIKPVPRLSKVIACHLVYFLIKPVYHCS